MADAARLPVLPQQSLARAADPRHARRSDIARGSPSATGLTQSRALALSGAPRQPKAYCEQSAVATPQIEAGARDAVGRRKCCYTDHAPCGNGNIAKRGGHILTAPITIAGFHASGVCFRSSIIYAPRDLPTRPNSKCKLHLRARGFRNRRSEAASTWMLVNVCRAGPHRCLSLSR